ECRQCRLSRNRGSPASMQECGRSVSSAYDSLRVEAQLFSDGGYGSRGQTDISVIETEDIRDQLECRDLGWQLVPDRNHAAVVFVEDIRLPRMVADDGDDLCSPRSSIAR